MMINGVWFKLDEALPPLDDSNGDCSIAVALVLKSGVLAKGFRYYNSEPNCWWVILDGKDIKLKDDEIAGWSKIPLL